MIFSRAISDSHSFRQSPLLRSTAPSHTCASKVVVALTGSYQTPASECASTYDNAEKYLGLYRQEVARGEIGHSLLEGARATAVKAECMTHTSSEDLLSHFKIFDTDHPELTSSESSANPWTRQDSLCFSTSKAPASSPTMSCC